MITYLSPISFRFVFCYSTRKYNDIDNSLRLVVYSETFRDYFNLDYDRNFPYTIYPLKDKSLSTLCLSYSHGTYCAYSFSAGDNSGYKTICSPFSKEHIISTYSMSET